MILDGLFLGILLSLILNCFVLYVLTILFPSRGTFRQYVILFVGQGIIGYMDMQDDIMSVVMAYNAKPVSTPKQRMNGLLDGYFSSLKGAQNA